MTDEPAFLAAIVADPGDDTARLAYADWLQEHDQDSRAEFIRVQCAIARTPEPEYYATSSLFDDDPAEYDAGICMQCRGLKVKCRYHLLRAQESTILRFHGERWRAPFESVTFRRGFVESVTCSAADWLQHAGALHWHPGQNRPCPVTAQPVRKVVLTTWPDWEWVVGPGQRSSRVPSLPRSGMRLRGVPAATTAMVEAATQVAPRLTRVCESQWPGVEFEITSPRR